MTPFTDDDLMRLEASEGQHGPHSQYEKGFLMALIARLEAAEVLIAVIENCDPSFQDTPVYEAWRKAAGKDK